MFKQINNSFKAPINRLGFIALVAGMAVMLISFVSGSDWFDYRWRLRIDLASFDQLLLDYARRWWQSGFRIGLAIAAAGGFIAWFYQPTLGRLFQWVRHG